MEMKRDSFLADVLSGDDLAGWQPRSQEAPSGSCPAIASPPHSLLASVALGTTLFLAPPAMAAAIPAFGTSPSVEDRRPAVTVATALRGADPQTSYRKLLMQSFGDQAKEAMAALSLTKSQLATVLRVTRPTIYEWLAGKEPSPGNADRLTAVLRLLARAGISSESPLNARFVRHALHERSASLVEMLSAGELDEAGIEETLREAVALGKEAESQRMSREDRLRARGYEALSPEQRRDQLNQIVTMLDWPK